MFLSELYLSVSEWNSLERLRGGSWGPINLILSILSIYKKNSIKQQAPSPSLFFSKLIKMHDLFWEASSFNHSLQLWNVSSVGDMIQMIPNTASFNGKIDSWDVSSVTTMATIFFGCKCFNKKIGGWLALPVSTRLSTAGMLATSRP
ncbi:BspA family leucine-rich repeat surface protein [archaeon]|nr:MAG: BspA family leucine-rich repeat surface protein [archaeon]